MQKKFNRINFVFFFLFNSDNIAISGIIPNNYCKGQRSSLILVKYVDESVKFCWNQFMLILSFFRQNFSFLSISFLLVAMLFTSLTQDYVRMSMYSIKPTPIFASNLLQPKTHKISFKYP